ncbi:M1 family metallopeptidase [Pseudoflavitalea sp. G-6-1-2]|uniref:M1 family metallopeptidase n=1 Tax=Pseudoflavitalea sp. G-6-1-2 TaxID=2728841 RepID=UPI001F0FBDC1|nr:M1 family metallopeptidase [Pseudoflavitalea sp. G-6-1-2]
MSQNIQNNPGSNHGNRFEQLGTILPTPNEYRTASGAPGPKYWQQRADYDIKCELDEEKNTLTGSETVTYFNNSPNTLTYLWLQLDENQHSTVNNANYQNSDNMPSQLNEALIDRLEAARKDNGYGFNIRSLSDITGKSLKYTINKTMMRVELPAPLKAGQQFVFKLNWDYKIADRSTYGGRGGFEFFPGDGNTLYTMAQWYPRLCVYSDFQGWQNHQFTGRGEFALTFGNFKVQMTVPADHVIGSTGECLNYTQNLSAAQKARWAQAQTSKEPVEIVTLAEAKAAEGNKSKAKKTWIYKADNVRDFAWTSSRKFVWDAMPAFVEGRKVMCMSFYPKESYGLYRKFSTKAVAHTIKTYSHFTIPYPYPVAQSVEASNGMEYPMICFNYGRTEKDGSYSEATKYGMLGVIIHEVGHNFFPMIINSDERQWSWMDEGLNSFVEYLTEEMWDSKFPVRGKGPAWAIVDYMKLPKDQLEPIMSNSENIARFGPNAYTKPATGLNILRETIMGRDLFDYSFKEYARRWAFKHPEPADLFRTLEDASGEDLDWFWRGWFYGTEPCDMSLDSVKYFKADGSLAVRGTEDRTESRKLDPPMGSTNPDISKERNLADKSITYPVDKDPELQDFYYRYARGKEAYDTTTYKVQVPSQITAADAASLERAAGKHFYEVAISNKGGLVMPVIIEWTYKDGTKEIDRIPAQVWRMNEKNIVKAFMKDKEVASVQLDPYRETADIDESNNNWGKIAAPSRFALYKAKNANVPRAAAPGINPMQKAEEKKKGF